MNAALPGWIGGGRVERGLRRLGPTGRQGVVSVLDRLIVAGTNFLTLVIVGRAAGVEALGVFALAWTAILAVTALQEAFVHSPYTVHVNALPEGAARRCYGGAAATLQALTALVAALAAGLAALALHTSDPAPGTSAALGTGAALALVLAFPAAGLREFARRFLFARMETFAVIVLDATFSFLQLGGLLLLALTGTVTPAAALLIMAGSSLLPAVAWWTLKGRHLIARPGAEELRTAFWRHARFGRWLGAGQMADLAVTHGVTWLLAALVGTAATGLFAAANSLVLVVNPLILGLGSVLLPRAARARHERGGAEVGRIVWKVTALLTAAVALVTLVVVLAGPSLVALLYALDPSRTIVLTVLLLALANLAGAASFAIDNGLMVVERQDVNFAASIIGLVVTFALALLLVPVWGVVGMAASVLGGTLLNALFQFAAFSRLVAPPPGPFARIAAPFVRDRP